MCSHVYVDIYVCYIHLETIDQVSLSNLDNFYSYTSGTFD